MKIFPLLKIKKHPLPIAVITDCLIALFIFSACERNYTDGRNDHEIDYFFQGYLLDAKTGLAVKEMVVECRDEYRYFQITYDSTSQNGSYAVCYKTYSDPHSYHMNNVCIKAYNDNFFGDTIVNKELFRTDTLKLNIQVKKVGEIIISLHNLLTVSNVKFAGNDKRGFGGMIRNYYQREFKPTGNDTTVKISAYPDQFNLFRCWFDDDTSSRLIDTVFYIQSGNSIHFDVSK